MKLLAHIIAALVLATVSMPSFSQDVHIRGEIEKLDHSVLMVKDAGGQVLDIRLADNATVSTMTKASLADITTGKFVGTAAHSGGPNGELIAMEVHIFANSLRGTGEGHRPMASGATMTNATVESTVAGVQGRVLTLSYKGGVQKVLVPDDTPIVLLNHSNRSALKPGEHVSFNATKQADGTLHASRVTVGVNGLIPPL